MKALPAFLFLLAFTGCAATRSSLPESDAVTVHTITNPLDRSAAFLATEEAMADSWSRWKNVNQLRQPETGTLSAKGFFSLSSYYNCEIGAKAKVDDKVIRITYTIGKYLEGDWTPTPGDVAKMKAQFRTMSDRVAKAVGGTIAP